MANHCWCPVWQVLGSSDCRETFVDADLCKHWFSQESPKLSENKALLLSDNQLFWLRIFSCWSLSWRAQSPWRGAFSTSFPSSTKQFRTFSGNSKRDVSRSFVIILWISVRKRPFFPKNGKRGRQKNTWDIPVVPSFASCFSWKIDRVCEVNLCARCSLDFRSPP